MTKTSLNIPCSMYRIGKRLYVTIDKKTYHFTIQGVAPQNPEDLERTLDQRLKDFHKALVKRLGGKESEPEVRTGTDGADLKRCREADGLSQAELAKRLGISRGSVAHSEQGRKRLPMKLIAYIQRSK